jgi:hypothetical protein
MKPKCAQWTTSNICSPAQGAVGGHEVPGGILLDLSIILKKK